jgi:hypothetical protein
VDDLFCVAGRPLLEHEHEDQLLAGAGDCDRDCVRHRVVRADAAEGGCADESAAGGDATVGVMLCGDATLCSEMQRFLKKIIKLLPRI